MKAKKVEEVPGIAIAESGIVLLDGPDGVAVAMVPEAARVTGERLIVAADEALTQVSGTQVSGASE